MPPMLRPLRVALPLAFVFATIFTVLPSAQQPPPIGVAAVTVGEGPYTYDTAEQHPLRVVVVTHGLSRPFGVAVLPNGDALVTERGRALRLVRHAGAGH